MIVHIDREIIKNAGLTKNERSVVNYLCKNSLFVPGKEERMVVAVKKRGRKKLFLNAMAKIYEVLEAQRAGR